MTTFFFSFAIKTDVKLWKLQSFDLTTSDLSVATYVCSLCGHMSWAAFCQLLSLGVHPLWLLDTLSKWLTLPNHKHLLPYARYHLGSCEFPQYLHLWEFLFCLILLCHVLFFSLMPLHGIEHFIAFYGFHEWLMCCLHFHPTGQGLYLLTGDFSCFLTVVNLHAISVIISSLFMPLINCSISLLSLCLHSFDFTLRHLIHSSTLSLCSPISLQYCKDSIVSLCHGLNFSLNTSNNPTLVLHFPCSHSFNVCTKKVPLSQDSGV